MMPQVLYAARLLAFICWRDNQTENNWRIYMEARDALRLLDL